MARLAVRRGFTVFDAFGVLGALVILGALAAVFLPAVAGRKGCGSRHLKDSTQVRGIHQALVVWQQSNNDEYPLPSRVDLNNSTVAEEGAAKDTTASIFSMLVFNGSIGTEMLYSPAEANGKIQVYDTYEFENPSGSVDPAMALWDPKLSADFTGPKPAHISYAHLLPHGERLKQKWNNSFNATDVILGNRGPQIAAVKYDANGIASPVFANNQSNTFLIHGSSAKWEGNIAYNDNHIEFAQSVAAGTYRLPDGAEREDVLFYDEPEDAAGLNHFLGIFIKAGPKREDFRAIWD